MPAFSAEEYERRVENVRAALRERGCDAAVITQPENICYLSGFWTPGYHVFQALVVPARKPPFLVVRNIEVDNVAEKSWIARHHAIDNLDRALDIFAEAMKAEGVDSGTIVMEVDGARQAITRLDLLSELLPNVTWAPDANLVDPFRACKSDGEIAYIRAAVAMAEAALLAGARSLRDARTDSDVAAAVHGELARAGSEFTGSPPYIVAGAASARTHALHARRPIGDRDHVWMEVSASVERYHGAVSRIAGRDLTGEARRHFAASAAAVQAMLAAMRPGVTAGEVDAAGRAAVDRLGLSHLWRNRAAYSLGLSFPPGLGEGHIIDLKPNDPRVLRPGMVFHLIPILKVPGLGAVGCTETVRVTPDGAERLGALPLDALDAEA
ncbi:Xaa-Pro peptidase family protein [Alsobacter sp. SYSU M60028]|uniref:Xaa-Pro peptidase family protein n=1 Tax=Alsobacter ponti TaxID=2962936 RepID=A0ABT1LHR8_9HYPH|nr:Xaa-Pro peptidase family protein [Alsobacter ponti]MCP8940999.1 Xaa-Pro peptidase family protein [Alsobacter ponti]